MKLDNNYGSTYASQILEEIIKSAGKKYRNVGAFISKEFSHIKWFRTLAEQNPDKIDFFILMYALLKRHSAESIDTLKIDDDYIRRLVRSIIIAYWRETYYKVFKVKITPRQLARRQARMEKYNAKHKRS